MLDFTETNVFRLRPVNSEVVIGSVTPLLIDNENIQIVCKAVRDFVVFTDRRIIAVDRQGFTGERTDFTTIPYNKMQVFSVVTAGTFDTDGVLEVWMATIGKIRFEFSGHADVAMISRLIANRGI